MRLLRACTGHDHCARARGHTWPSAVPPVCRSDRDSPIRRVDVGFEQHELFLGKPTTTGHAMPTQLSHHRACSAFSESRAVHKAPKRCSSVSHWSFSLVDVAAFTSDREKSSTALNFSSPLGFVPDAAGMRTDAVREVAKSPPWCTQKRGEMLRPSTSSSVTGRGVDMRPSSASARVSSSSSCARTSGFRPASSFLFNATRCCSRSSQDVVAHAGLCT